MSAINKRKLNDLISTSIGIIIYSGIFIVIPILIIYPLIQKSFGRKDEIDFILSLLLSIIAGIISFWTLYFGLNLPRKLVSWLTDDKYCSGDLEHIVDDLVQLTAHIGKKLSKKDAKEGGQLSIQDEITGGELSNE